MQLIEYKINVDINIADIIDLFKSSGINRPIEDQEKIKAMFKNANLVVSAWEGNMLIGIARSLTDSVYCTYLSDLAVREEYQKKRIGKSLVELTRAEVGDHASLLLLSNENAMGYYPKLGFEKAENAFLIRRE